MLTHGFPDDPEGLSGIPEVLRRLHGCGSSLAPLCCELANEHLIAALLTIRS